MKDMYEAFENGAGLLEMYELAEEQGLNGIEVVEYFFGDDTKKLDKKSK